METGEKGVLFDRTRFAILIFPVTVVVNNYIYIIKKPV